MTILGNVLMLYAAAVLISSPVLYHWWSRGDWRLTTSGRHVMAFMAGLALVMCFAVASLVMRATDHGDLPRMVRPIVWVIVSFIASWRLWLLWRSRYRGE